MKNREVIETHHKEVSKGIQDIYSELRNGTLPIFGFIDELDNSRMYCYVILKVSKEIDEELYDEIDDIGFGAEYLQYERWNTPYGNKLFRIYISK